MNTLPARLTWLDVVRQEMRMPVLPHPDFADHVLWNETAFPFADVEHIRRQVREFRDSHGDGR
jgi:hypothetical protein